MNALNPLYKNTYLISTNIKSFGFIIGDCDTSKTNENFFEIFHFDTAVIKQLFSYLSNNKTNITFAQDMSKQGFLFFKPCKDSNLFAFVKRIDINGDIAATIIQEQFNEVISCVDSAHESCSDMHYAEMCNLLYHIKRLFSVDLPYKSSSENMLRSAEGISDYFSIKSNINIDPDTSSTKDGYVFCVNGFTLFLSFVCTTALKHGNTNNPYISIQNIDGVQIIKVKLNCTNANNLTPKLDFLRDTLDAQNLSLFYEINDKEIKMIFLPYYIDDGLFGVKAPINLENF